jgi:hypothetical protein
MRLVTIAKRKDCRQTGVWLGRELGKQDLHGTEGMKLQLVSQRLLRARQRDAQQGLAKLPCLVLRVPAKEKLSALSKCARKQDRVGNRWASRRSEGIGW